MMHPYLTEFLLFLSTLRLVLSQAGTDFDYGYNEDKHQSSYRYDHYEGDFLEFICYSCTFQIRSGKASGYESCRDPFVAMDIPEVPCSGHCAKIYLNISVTDFSITRQCLPGCEDQQDDRGYTQCCGGNHCNHGYTVHSNILNSMWSVLTVIYTMLS